MLLITSSEYNEGYKWQQWWILPTPSQFRASSPSSICLASFFFFVALDFAAGSLGGRGSGFFSGFSSLSPRSSPISIVPSLGTALFTWYDSRFDCVGISGENDASGSSGAVMVKTSIGKVSATSLAGADCGPTPPNKSNHQRNRLDLFWTKHNRWTNTKLDRIKYCPQHLCYHLWSKFHTWLLYCPTPEVTRNAPCWSHSFWSLATCHQNKVRTGEDK